MVGYLLYRSTCIYISNKSAEYFFNFKTNLRRAHYGTTTEQVYRPSLQMTPRSTTFSTVRLRRSSTNNQPTTNNHPTTNQQPSYNQPTTQGRSELTERREDEIGHREDERTIHLFVSWRACQK